MTALVNGGFAYWQLAGAKKEGINQHRNKNQSADTPSFCADIYDDKHRVFITTAAYRTIEEVDAALEHWIPAMEQAPVILPPSEAHSNRIRGIIE